MMLVIEDEAGTRSVVPFADDAIVVGRGADGVTFRLTDRNVSRRHARFLRQNGNVFVEDLGSLTGTRVNGERIVGRRRLRDGDLVQIGDYDLAILSEAPALAGAPPPLPPSPRVDANAVTAKLPPVADVPRPAPAVAAPSAVRRSKARLVVAAIVLLAVAIAAAVAAGALTVPEMPPLTRP